MDAMDRTLSASLLLLGLVFGLFECTGIDLSVQDRLFDFHAGTWWVDWNAHWPHLLCYTAPKIMTWLAGLFLLLLACAPDRWRAHLPFPNAARRDLWICVGTLALAPAMVAGGKASTNVFTPREIRRYGGFAPYVKVAGSYPPGDRPSKRGRGFPAGHASGGFALLSLAGLARSRQARTAALATGLGAGALMGIYQMLRGAHFLSHTIVSALVCWIVFLLLRRLAGRWAGHPRKPAGICRPHA